jgi:hypothetical protein
MTTVYTPNGPIEIDDANPDPAVLASLGWTRQEFEQMFHDSLNWDNFREWLKTGIFLQCAASTAVPAFLAAEIRGALDKRSYENLIQWVNGISNPDPEQPKILKGLKDYIEFSPQEQLDTNQAAADNYLPGPIFS